MHRAVLAPANPSGADGQFTAQASRLETQAHQEITEARRAKANGEEDPESRFDTSVTPLELREFCLC